MAAARYTFPCVVDGTHHKLGYYDNASRWYPDAALRQFYAVRSPSRQWPYSYLKHTYTSVFAKKLAIHDWELFRRLASLDARDESTRARARHWVVSKHLEDQALTAHERLALQVERRALEETLKRCRALARRPRQAT